MSDELMQELMEVCPKSEINFDTEEFNTSLLLPFTSYIERCILSKDIVPLPRGCKILKAENSSVFAETTLTNIISSMINHHVPFVHLAIKIGDLLYRLLDVDHSFSISPRDSLVAGRFCLVAICARFPQYFKIEYSSEGNAKNDQYIVKCSKKLLNILPDILHQADYICLPMICTPKRWISTKTGGYKSNVLQRQKNFIRHVNTSKIKGYSFNQIPNHYRFANKVQAVAWKIDSLMLDLIEWAIDNQIEVSKFPFTDIPDLQKWPLAPDRKKEDFTEQDKVAVSQWYLINSKIQSKINTIKGRQISIKMALDIAIKYKDYAKIYFPHNYDYRGRLYPISIILNPQSTDCIKAMICPAEAQPLKSANAVRWAKIHVANLYGIDKESYDNRVKWFDDNELAILFAASDPRASTFWRDADKPWQFIQACIEWAKYCKDPEAPVNIMIAMDGSCSGIQHYSAMLRDPVGGKSVNLLPADKPQDIYQEIADKLLERISSDNSDLANLWRDIGITRKVTKRPVMTLPYGLSQYTCTEYIEDYLIELNSPKVDNIKSTALYLSKNLWPVIQENLKGACMAMDWLKKCIKIVSTSEKIDLIKWTTSLNFPVHHKFVRRKEARFNTNFYPIYPKDKEIRLNYYKQPASADLDIRKMQSAIGPNFVHSYDATHLCMVINNLADQGVENFCVIHDSISTHVNDADIMYKSIRDTFIDLYQNNDVLLNFKNSLEEKHGVELPDPPSDPSFTLDLSVIADSPYLFS